MDFLKNNAGTILIVAAGSLVTMYAVGQRGLVWKVVGAAGIAVPVVYISTKV